MLSTISRGAGSVFSLGGNISNAGYGPFPIATANVTGTSTNTTTVSSSTLTYPANAFIMAFFGADFNVSPGNPDVSISGGGLTWNTWINSPYTPGNSSFGNRIFIGYASGNTNGGSVVTTITAPNRWDVATLMVLSFTGVDLVNPFLDFSGTYYINQTSNSNTANVGYSNASSNSTAIFYHTTSNSLPPTQPIFPNSYAVSANGSGGTYYQLSRLDLKYFTGPQVNVAANCTTFTAWDEIITIGLRPPVIL